jgi:hypothetical protein
MNNISKQTAIRHEHAQKIKQGMEDVTAVLLDTVELMPFIIQGMTKMGEELSSIKERLDAIDPRKTGGMRNTRRLRQRHRSKKHTRSRR